MHRKCNQLHGREPSTKHNNSACAPAREMQVLELFEQCIDLPKVERDAWLHEQCGEDVVLRKRVERLLLIDRLEPTWRFYCGATVVIERYFSE